MTSGLSSQTANLAIRDPQKTETFINEIRSILDNINAGASKGAHARK